MIFWDQKIYFEITVVYEVSVTETTSTTRYQESTVVEEPQAKIHFWNRYNGRKSIKNYWRLPINSPWGYISNILNNADTKFKEILSILKYLTKMKNT